MLGFTLDSFGAPPALRDDLRPPRLVDDGLLVRIRASSVNGADVAIAAGMLREMVEHEFPVILGRDFSGVVDEVGAASGVTRPGMRCSDSCFTPTRRFMRAAGPS